MAIIILKDTFHKRNADRFYRNWQDWKEVADQTNDPVAVTVAQEAENRYRDYVARHAKEVAQ